MNTEQLKTRNIQDAEYYGRSAREVLTDLQGLADRLARAAIDYERAVCAVAYSVLSEAGLKQPTPKELGRTCRALRFAALAKARALHGDQIRERAFNDAMQALGIERAAGAKGGVQ